MKEQNLSEITYVRLSPEMKAALERIASVSMMTRRVSDHVRFAVEQYVAAEEAKSAQTSIAQS